MKKPLKILIGILAILIVLSFVKDIIIKISVEKGVQIATGLPLKMQGFRVGILRTLVSIKGLKLYNPEGYPDKVMLDMPQIHIDYNLIPTFRGKLHFQDMRINLKEFYVVKNKDGEVNLNSLNAVKEEKEKKKKKKAQKKVSGKAPEVQIDNFELKIGKVIYKDIKARDKEQRASSLRGYVLQERITFVDAPWTAAMLDELGNFPGGAFDDQVDALAMPAREFLRVGAPLSDSPRQQQQPEIPSALKRVDGRLVVNSCLNDMFKQREQTSPLSHITGRRL